METLFFKGKIKLKTISKSALKQNSLASKEKTCSTAILTIGIIPNHRQLQLY